MSPILGGRPLPRHVPSPQTQEAAGTMNKNEVIPIYVFTQQCKQEFTTSSSYSTDSNKKHTKAHELIVVIKATKLYITQEVSTVEFLLKTLRDMWQCAVDMKDKSVICLGVLKSRDQEGGELVGLTPPNGTY
jgi:hypothetical protein